MLFFLAVLLYASLSRQTPVGSASSLLKPRDDGPPDPGCSTIPDPGLTPIPDTAKPDNTFHNGAPERVMDDPYSSDPIPNYYQPRNIDLPFGRMVHGNMSMFPYGQVNDPTLNTNNFKPGLWDYANQRSVHCEALARDY